MSDEPARLVLHWGCPICSKEDTFTYDPRADAAYLATIIEHNHRNLDKICPAKKADLVVLDIYYESEEES